MRLSGTSFATLMCLIKPNPKINVGMYTLGKVLLQINITSRRALSRAHTSANAQQAPYYSLNPLIV